MVRPTDERFPKGVRIRKRTEYLEIQRAGAALHGRLLIGIVRRAGDRAETRLGITTTKKLGPAVVRNRIRRLVREAFRRNRDALPAGLDLVVVAKRASRGCTAAAIADELLELGRRAARHAEPSR
ncbi:MAG: ribonuclease P protein component [Proteobacteria bacterium]|jgi:ribonuclease P protein component|nr:ribonuclease P protein component [Pseudomonadota bacterium]